jgi:hypothetical protein
MAVPATTKRKASDIIVATVPINEEARLNLAVWLLLGLAILLVLGALAYILATDVRRGEKIFEASITVLPPIATLVVGYYFAQKKR